MNSIDEMKSTETKKFKSSIIKYFAHNNTGITLCNVLIIKSSVTALRLNFFNWYSSSNTISKYWLLYAYLFFKLKTS